MSLDQRITKLEEDAAERDAVITKVVKLIEKVQYTGTGIGIYFIADNLGLIEALKLLAGKS